MKDWYRNAFAQAMADAHHTAANAHGVPKPLDQILRDRLFPDSPAERAQQRWMETHFPDRLSTDLEPDRPEQDHSIDR